MTALCGIYSPGNPRYATREILERMLRVIQHRGGNCRRQHVDEQMGLAVAVASSTPCYENQEPSNWYKDPEYVAALDGHIYNWRDLLGDPSTLSGESEGAAAVALLRDIPSDFPEALDGSFALALWEKPSRRLWLVRDALGRKPLYYSVVETGTILFASEPKAIIEYRARAPRLSREALSAYITFGNVPAPLTLFEGINKLFPGQALQVNSDGAVTKCHYWHVPPFDPYAHSLDDLAGPIREGLLNTLEKQLRNAKRVGVFLSGGADSTILLGALKLLGVQDRHSFTLSHSNGQQVDNRDDCDWARTVATLHGATHHVIEVDTHPAISSRVPELLSLFDDPVILENRVAGCDLLTREAAKTGVELCLSGNNQQAFGGIWEWKTLRELLAQDSTRHLTTEGLVLEAHLNLFSVKEQCALLGADEEEVGRVAASLLNWTLAINRPFSGSSVCSLNNFRQHLSDPDVICNFSSGGACYLFDIESSGVCRDTAQKALQHLIERRSIQRHADSGFEQCFGVFLSMPADEVA